jgi:hypothetical protein
MSFMLRLIALSVLVPIATHAQDIYVPDELQEWR